MLLVQLYMFAGVAHSEMESSHTVVTSRTAVSSDGTVSHSRDIIKGEFKTLFFHDNYFIVLLCNTTDLNRIPLFLDIQSQQIY